MKLLTLEYGQQRARPLLPRPVPVDCAPGDASVPVVIRCGSSAAVSPCKVLFDASVAIRPFRAQDAPRLYAATCESLDQLSHSMTWCRPDYSLADSERFIAQSEEAWRQDEQYNFAIIDPADTRLLGSVGLNQVNRVHQFANLAYWVRSSQARRGIAPAAARLAAGFGLRELGLQRLEILVAAENFASQRVAQKTGAKFEGILRNRLALRGRLHEAVLYSLVSEDLVPLRVPRYTNGDLSASAMPATEFPRSQIINPNT